MRLDGCSGPTAALTILALVACACGGGAAAPLSIATPSATPSVSPSPAPTSVVVQQPSYLQTRTITVQGVADISEENDMAVVFISFSVSAGDIHTALDRSEEIRMNVRSQLQALGAHDIQDESVSAYPAYSSYPASAYRSVSARLPNGGGLSHSLGLLEERIRGILTGDENVNLNVSFEVEDDTAARAKARSKAIANARAGAEQIAEETGLTLGDIVTVVEGSDVDLSFSVPTYGPAPAGGGGAGGSGTGYPPQNTKPTVTVTVTFEVK